MSDTHGLYIYDVESYPNIFTCAARHFVTGTRYNFEISDRVNQAWDLIRWLTWLKEDCASMVGFNNIGYDYPVVHYLIKGAMDAGLLYQKTCSIINSFDNRYAHRVWENEHYVRQIDLFSIHHFDNKARMTSLKDLEFAMRMESIQDLPFSVGSTLTHSQMDELHNYNNHDVDATADFLEKSLNAISFRKTLSEKYQQDFTNQNDTSIGKKYFIKQLNEAGIKCDKHTQTPRPHGIPLSDIILPFLSFNRPEFKTVLDWLKDYTVKDTRATLGLYADIDGFVFDFGLGGLHGSVDSQLVTATDERMIIDLDVVSYYPSIAIEHGFFPEHLSKRFCDIYSDLKKQRVSFAKKTPENDLLKLALNGVYGDSNNEYSPLFDPKYTMAITINGQLMLAMLAERLIETIPELKMIQANTDGITVSIPRRLEPTLISVWKWWEELTKLKLERADYSRMWVRDVNSYVAETTKGELKQKGCYVTKPDWHQDHSKLVVPKLAVKYLVEGGDLLSMVRDHPDMMDFMCRAKVRRSDQLLWGSEEVQRISRYYVTPKPHGARLAKRMPLSEKQLGQLEVSIHKLTQKRERFATQAKPRKLCVKDEEKLAKAEIELASGMRYTGICVGQNVHLCNSLWSVTAPVDYSYYVEEIRKITDPVTRTAESSPATVHQ